jgi:hypothetical protein
MNGKPRIRREFGRWYCGAVAYGDTPAEAYSRWVGFIDWMQTRAAHTEFAAQVNAML